MRDKKPDSLFDSVKRLRRKRLAIKYAWVIVFLSSALFFWGNDFFKVIRDSIIYTRVIIADSTDAIDRFFSNLWFFVSHDIDKSLDDLYFENIKLRQKIRLMDPLVEENDVLRDLLSLKKRTEKNIIIAKVVTIFSGDFACSCVINRGANDGIVENSCVIVEQGMVGRVIEVHDAWSLVLLINDMNSNIPAKIGDANVIVSGNNSGKMQISLVHEDIRPEDGKIVETSGYGVEEKIPVGVLKRKGNQFSVIPFANLNSLKFVGVIVEENH